MPHYLQFGYYPIFINFAIMESKGTTIGKKSILTDIILNNHSLILVLERFGIKLGLGNKPVETICKEYNIGTKLFLTILNLHNATSYDNTASFSFSDIKNVITYLRKSHQYYSEEVFPGIISNIKRLKNLNTSPGVLMVEDFFNQYKKEVDRHFDYENSIVFPYMLNILENHEFKQGYSVVDYKKHHDNIEEKLEDLKRLLIEHLPQSKDASLRRKILFALFNLEQDIKVHAEIENEILIPFIEKLENQNKN